MTLFKHRLALIFSCFTMIILLLDPTTAGFGGISGIRLCTDSVIPSLFPFIFICNYFNGNLSTLHTPFNRFLEKILHIPSDLESTLLLSFLGGYPVGAQTVADMYHDRILSKRSAEIYLGYFSNAGPAFIFGVAGMLFTAEYVCWILWMLQIISALITGILLPSPGDTDGSRTKCGNLSLVSALQKSLKICASISGWIILFRILLGYTDKYLLRKCSISSVILSGLLELSNGCLNLSDVSSEPLRFVLCAVFLSAGGLCIVLQTASVTKELGLGLYIPGKLIQTSVCLLLSIPLSYILFPHQQLPMLWIMPILIFCVCTIAVCTHRCRKKVWNSCKN